MNEFLLVCWVAHAVIAIILYNQLLRMVQAGENLFRMGQRYDFIGFSMKHERMGYATQPWADIELSLRGGEKSR